MNFLYKAVDKKGKKHKGDISAEDKAAAISMLKSKGLVPIEIDIAEETEAESGKRQKNKKKKTFLKIEIFKKDIHEVKIKKKRILALLNEFAIMMKAGVSLSMCLEVLVEQEKDGSLKEILEEIRDDMYGGRTLSYSMGKFRTFSEITINIIFGGEVNGRLDLAFERAGKILENEININDKVKNAIMYPSFLLVVTLGVVALLNILVLPVFADMFSRMGAELPLITRFVMGTSILFAKYWYVLVVFILLLIGLYIYKKKTSAGFCMVLDRMKLKIPVVGKILHKVYVARFCRMMASLVDAGVEIVHALTVSTNVIPNLYIKKFMNEVLEDVKVGVTINKSMAKFEIFDTLLISMVRVGEESGMLSDVLDKMAELYEAQSEALTKQLTTLMEPMMTVLIAIVVGTVIISVVLPMFGQYNLIV